MKLRFNPRQGSTWRGLVYVIGGLSAIHFLDQHSIEHALAAIAIAKTVAGAIGMGVDDGR